MVPLGEEYNTLEHKLAKWAIENGVIELVLGDSIHREIVARSTELMKFLAGMCHADEPIEPIIRCGVVSPMQTDMIPNQYCLRASHLLMAWKTCTNQRDDAVSAQIYQLLVSILPSLSDELSVPLMNAIHESLVQSLDKEDHFLEVSQFCTAVAEKFFDPEGNTPNDESFECIDNNTRKEALNLLWAVLTHKDALTLKSCMHIERFTFAEIGRQQDEVAESMREKFLTQCKDFLRSQDEEFVDESHALRMCQLSRSVLEGYDRANMEKYVMGSGGFAEMLFEELVAYLHRRAKAPSTPPIRKVRDRRLFYTIASICVHLEVSASSQFCRRTCTTYPAAVYNEHGEHGSRIQPCERPYRTPVYSSSSLWDSSKYTAAERSD
jgi:hypothetical protein